MKKDRSLATMTKTVGKSVMKDLEQEIVQEHVEMVRDYIKGAYRLRYDLEKQVEDLQRQIKGIDEALDLAEKGNVESVKKIKVPAKYLSEKTVRLADLDWDSE